MKKQCCIAEALCLYSGGSMPYGGGLHCLASQGGSMLYGGGLFLYCGGSRHPGLPSLGCEGVG